MKESQVKSDIYLKAFLTQRYQLALLWAAIDITVIVVSTKQSAEAGNMFLFLIAFMLLHMMPVWIYLGGVIFTARRYKNTNYIVTDYAVYISKGIFRKTFISKPFSDMSHINLHRGIFDQRFGVGDVILTTNKIYGSGENMVTLQLKLESIENYQEVYNMVKKLQKDIYTDVMYPNDKRPKKIMDTIQNIKNN